MLSMALELTLTQQQTATNKPTAVAAAVTATVAAFPSLAATNVTEETRTSMPTATPRERRGLH